MKQTFIHQFSPMQSKTYVEHTFNVEEGVQQIDFTLERYDPQVSQGQCYENQVNFTIFDPQGAFRGWRYAYQGLDFSIGASGASYGCAPGTLLSGEWTILINVFRILPPATLDLTLTVATQTTQSLPAQPAYETPAPAKKGAGWYTGDLHSHTFHSDGMWSVEHINAFARRLGLDFLHLSDHNTISGNTHHRSFSDNDCLSMAGIELTMPWGHAVVVGAEKWQDWGVRNTQPYFRPIAERLHAAGHFVTIAHPKNVGEPSCGGCRWIFEDDIADLVSAVEVWNGIWALSDNNNPQGLALYYEWLNEGHRLSVTSGTDLHGLPLIQTDENGLPEVHWVKEVTDEHIASIQPGTRIGGAAFNVVWAEEFSEAGILAGLKAGRVYISDGPRLDFTANSQDGERVMLGGALPRSLPTTLNVQGEQCSHGDVLRLIADGEVLYSAPAAENGQYEVPLDAHQAHWCVVEVRNAQDDLRAVTSPIYFA